MHTRRKILCFFTQTKWNGKIILRKLRCVIVTWNSTAISIQRRNRPLVQIQINSLWYPLSSRIAAVFIVINFQCLGYLGNVRQNLFVRRLCPSKNKSRQSSQSENHSYESDNPKFYFHDLNSVDPAPR